ncbi:response regulator transcription factor [Streptomyces olivoreticuli]|uniref:response regulator transcription factor n=1 Tax=Streptomyces olivoreticuli TaxID=68246 RepID=UPI001F08633E|nr:response regulator transcription factor [Streptomyces olivoreticuli]
MCAYILVAEDDKKQAGLIHRYLEHEKHTVTVVHDGRAALEEVRRQEPDLLILDVMMPKTDGLDVVRILRRETDLPVLLLTARSTEDDLLLGLDLGADDYMTKPYSPRELMARVRTLLRRTRHAGLPDGSFHVGGLTVDPIRYEVRQEDRLIDCTPGEFQILAAMAAEPNRVFTRPQLLAAIHGSGRYITDRTVDVHIMNLRKKIEADPRQPAHLLTVFGVGYKLTDSPASTQGPHRAG